MTTETNQIANAALTRLRLNNMIPEAVIAQVAARATTPGPKITEVRQAEADAFNTGLTLAQRQAAVNILLDYSQGER